MIIDTELPNEKNFKDGRVSHRILQEFRSELTEKENLRRGWGGPSEPTEEKTWVDWQVCNRQWDTILTKRETHGKEGKDLIL